jgi:hypothetical protein
MSKSQRWNYKPEPYELSDVSMQRLSKSEMSDSDVFPSSSFTRTFLNRIRRKDHSHPWTEKGKITASALG